MKNLIIFFPALFLLLFSCDNQHKISESKTDSKNEAQEIENLKEKHNFSIDSLNKELSALNQNKENVSNDLEYAYANIHHILSNSSLDHIIVGTKNLKESKSFFKDALGFQIKDGREHKNGLSNFFIEFQDSSEIEIMSVQNPNDNLSKHYSKLLSDNNYGLQYSLRTNSIIELANSFKKIGSNFSIFAENKSYSTLANKIFDKRTPFFFIQYNTDTNIKNKHDNNTFGISTVWFSTPNIRQSVKQYSEFGFALIDTISIADIKSKTALMKNENFEIILIDDRDFAIIGISIKSKDISNLKTRLDSSLNVNLEIKKTIRGKSIFLSPIVTQSIWFEFLESR